MSSRRHEAHQQALDLLRLVGYFLTFLYSLLGFAHFFLMQEEYKWVLIYFTAITVLVSVLAASLASRFSEKVSSRLSLLLLIMASTNGLLHLWLSASSFQTTNLFIAIIAIGIVFSNRKLWMIGVGYNWMAWIVIVNAQNMTLTQHFFFAMAMSTMLSWFAHLTRKNLVDMQFALQSERDLALQREKAANAATAAKSSFLVNMSHEIRTPMNGVIGMLDLVSASGLDEDQRRKIAVAKVSADSLLGVINDILDFSKIEAEQLLIEQTDFDLIDLFDSFASTMAYQAHLRNIELVIDVTRLHGGLVVGDPVRLRQILNNLTSNAIKFTEHGEVIVRAIATEHAEGWRLSVSISDTGIGIPQDLMEVLFESFTQADSSTTRRYGGTGLGLTISKQLCQLMGGGIRVDSEVGVGSTFHFDVLLGQASMATDRTELPDLQGLRILVTGDNPSHVTVFRHQLENWGGAVDTAASGKEALSLCEDAEEAGQLYDIVFMDMHMPQMDGKMLAQKIRANSQWHSLKLILLTSSGDEHLNDLQALGFSARFTKPVSIRDLEAVLKTAMTRASDEAVPARHMTAEARELDFKGVKILIVEDNKINQMVLEGLLEDLRIDVTVASDGLEAVELLKTLDYDSLDLVLMDCQMPRMDGFEATRQIRAGNAGQLFTSIPIIAMTANAMKGEKEKCMDAGMSDYLTKPIDVELLEHTLGRHCLTRV